MQLIMLPQVRREMKARIIYRAFMDKTSYFLNIANTELIELDGFFACDAGGIIAE